MTVQTLGPWTGVYRPDYDIQVFSNGDPTRPVTGVDLRSVTLIRTTKNLSNISGTFTITLKDRRAQNLIKPMDVVIIRLKGHNQGWGTVFKGLVDTPEPSGTAQITTSQADVTITGRCMAKYLQSNSMFLPIWDPQANLPTALIFGLGDAQQKLGTTVHAYTPRAIFGYIYQHFVVGLRNRVGLSGTPNARFWLNATNRFEFVQDAAGKVFQIPFIQFDEDTTDVALSQLCIPGFTEGWVDEVGNIVYRRPQWDAPISYTLGTGGLINWDLPESDVAMATYVECYPAGLPALPSGAAQAMLAGRAPIPSDYVTGLQKSGFTSIASPEFIIDTDATGEVTATGAKNWYYQKQKQYGLRPYQITSPLLADREQAQAQAEGLLRFMLRWDKSGTLTIPGEPGVLLGTTLLAHGPLDDQNINRTYYAEGITQEYVEGDHYTTTIQVSHGRDPGDPGWQQMALPNYEISQLASISGILWPAPATTPGKHPSSLRSSLSLGTTPVGVGDTSGVGTDGYISPFKLIKNLSSERIDMGVDYNAAEGSPILALGDALVMAAAPGGTGWTSRLDTQACVYLKLLAGPYKGKTIYIGEDIVPTVSTGQTVKAGQVVAKFLASTTGLEIGWGSGTPYGPLAASLNQQAPGSDPGAWSSAAGASFNRLLVALGCPSGVSQGAPHGTMPPGYP